MSDIVHRSQYPTNHKPTINMKFVFAVVMLAIAAGAQAGVLAPATYTAVSGAHLGHAPVLAPTVYAAHGYAAHGYAAHGYAAHAYAAPLAYAAPAAVAYHAPAAVAYHAAPAVVAAPVAVAHEGTYVAKTRGAEHVAPLPGHLNSAASVNLEPAPGTL